MDTAYQAEKDAMLAAERRRESGRRPRWPGRRQSRYAPVLPRYVRRHGEGDAHGTRRQRRIAHRAARALSRRYG